MGYRIYKLNFAKTIWWWKFEHNEECTAESVIKFGWDVNITPVQDDEIFDMWVSSMWVGCMWYVINCCKPNCAVTFSISFP